MGEWKTEERSPYQVGVCDSVVQLKEFGGIRVGRIRERNVALLG